MSTTRTTLHRKDTAKPGDLYLSFELGDKSWKLTIGDGGGAVSRYTVAAGDKSGVADCILRAGKRFKTSARAQVHSCYEAGRAAVAKGPKRTLIPYGFVLKAKARRCLQRLLSLRASVHRSSQILARTGFEMPQIVTAELRRTLVANSKRGTGHVVLAAYQQAARLQ